MEALTDSMKALLYGMANITETDMKFSSIRARSSLSKGTLSKNLTRLNEKGILYRHRHGAYRFALPLFKNTCWRRTSNSAHLADLACSAYLADFLIL